MKKLSLTLALLLVSNLAMAAPQPIRDSAYDWRCLNPDGTATNHQRQDTAIYACQTRAEQNPGQTYYIEGGRYRVLVSVPVPDPDPVPDPAPDPDPVPDPDPIPDPGTAPYVIQGTIPSGWSSRVNWPAAPVTTRTATVSSASQLNSVLAGGAVVITLQAANYGSVSLGSASNVELRSAAPGAAVFTMLRIDGDRVKVSGVRINGWLDLTQGPRNLLLDNLHINGGGGSPSVYIGGSARGFDRVAIVRSTITNNGDMFPMLYAGSGGANLSSNLIVAGSYIDGLSGQPNNDPVRIGHTTNSIWADNWIHGGTTANQFRHHNEIDGVLLTNNTLVGGASKLFIDQAGDGVGGYARNLYVVGNRMYSDHGQGPFTSLGNNGVVSSFSAVGNRDFSTSQAGGSSTMENWNGGGTVLFQDNLRVPYQSPPVRTVGASH